MRTSCTKSSTEAARLWKKCMFMAQLLAFWPSHKSGKEKKAAADLLLVVSGPHRFLYPDYQHEYRPDVAERDLAEAEESRRFHQPEQAQKYEHPRLDYGISPALARV